MYSHWTWTVINVQAIDITLFASRQRIIVIITDTNGLLYVSVIWKIVFFIIVYYMYLFLLKYESKLPINFLVGMQCHFPKYTDCSDLMSSVYKMTIAWCVLQLCLYLNHLINYFSTLVLACHYLPHVTQKAGKTSSQLRFLYFIQLNDREYHPRLCWCAAEKSKRS